MSGSDTKWLALGYSVPANPSRSRVYVWRKLREIGAEYFKPGVAVLPNSPENHQLFETLGTKIRELDGEAWMIELNFVSQADDEQMEERFRKAADREYSELLDECSQLLLSLEQSGDKEQRMQLAGEMKKMLRRYQRSALFKMGSEVAGELEQGMNEVLEKFKAMPGEFSAFFLKK